MIESVEPKSTPTQYVAFYVQPQGGAWDAQEVTLRAYATDSLNGMAFEKTLAIEEPEAGPMLIKVGPFRRGATVDIGVTTVDSDGEPVDAWVGQLVMGNDNSPAVIVRQGVFDILEAAELEGVGLIKDEWGRPSSVAEDAPYVGGQLAVEVGAPSSRKRKETQVRSAVQCEVPIRVFVIGYGRGEAFVQADNLAWQIQQKVDRAPSLYLSGIGVKNFSWQWDVRPPDVVEVEGNSMNIVVQEMVLTVPVDWPDGAWD